MAEQLPTATFLGIDTSRVQVAAGKKAVEAVGLKNVELREQDILDFSGTEGKFDYIIVHGIYSWVPDAVRERIMTICSDHLSDTGIAYISYNAHPGWSMRQSLRDMMLFHTRNITDSKSKVQQARALLAFLADSVPTENNAYGILLKNESSLMSGLSDNYLLHDILGAENTAFYFHEFVEAAGRHGLQYVGEPNVAEMLATNFPERVRGTLAQLNNQIVAQEQYMDFLRNRSFRQTLLCSAKVKLQRNLSPESLNRFAFRSLLLRASGPVELVPGMNVTFVGSGGAQITSSDAFVKALLLALVETRGVAAISFTELLASARSRSRPFVGELPENANQVEELTALTNLLNLLAKGFIELYAEPVGVRTDVPEKPLVSTLTRYQALNARLLTNRIHYSVPADLASRYVVAACDGQRTRDGIVENLVERVTAGQFQVNEGSVKITEEAKIRALLAPTVDIALKLMGESGFFSS